MAVVDVAVVSGVVICAVMCIVKVTVVNDAASCFSGLAKIP